MPGMTPGFAPHSSAQWTPARDSAAADYSSLDKDAADLGAQLDFFGAQHLLPFLLCSCSDFTA